MNVFKTKLIIGLITFSLLIGAIVGGGLYLWLPTFSPNWFIGIFLFFLVQEILFISFIEKYSKKVDRKQMVNMYMLTKVIKVFTSLAFILIYVLLVKINVREFVAVFLSFYLLFLIVETVSFLQIEKHLKKNKIKDE